MIKTWSQPINQLIYFDQFKVKPLTINTMTFLKNWQQNDKCNYVPYKMTNKRQMKSPSLNSDRVTRERGLGANIYLNIIHSPNINLSILCTSRADTISSTKPISLLFTVNMFIHCHVFVHSISLSCQLSRVTYHDRNYLTLWTDCEWKVALRLAAILTGIGEHKRHTSPCIITWDHLQSHREPRGK
jgi:hypothetical protein